MQFLPLLQASPLIKTTVRNLRNQPAVRRFMYSDHEIGEAEHDAWLQSLDGNPCQSVFVVMIDGNACGVVSLNAVNATHRSADWAFYLDSGLQGKGVGSRVEFWLLDHAFNAASLEKLNCEVLATNQAVIRLHQKFGFTVEGVRRQNVIKDGERIDVVLLGITREEWAVQRPTMLALMERLAR
ncbi:MAG TPA: UDP-4-amino-4,6-dideoxy-N-acetyl-beta-L-altrosamine N-acetyltransferase [Pseudomonas sp.]|jgi:UDP-4-amino-4,6-dideoxy-N-acetyl-beta-L-altrosamine N-acetyltransferase